MNFNQCERHKDIRGKFIFLVSAEFYLVSFVRPYQKTLRNFKQNFKNVTILKGFYLQLVTGYAGRPKESRFFG